MSLNNVIGNCNYYQPCETMITTLLIGLVGPDWPISMSVTTTDNASFNQVIMLEHHPKTSYTVYTVYCASWHFGYFYNSGRGVRMVSCISLYITVKLLHTAVDSVATVWFQSSYLMNLLSNWECSTSREEEAEDSLFPLLHDVFTTRTCCFRIHMTVSC